MESTVSIFLFFAVPVIFGVLSAIAGGLSGAISAISQATAFGKDENISTRKAILGWALSFGIGGLIGGTFIGAGLSQYMIMPIVFLTTSWAWQVGIGLMLLGGIGGLFGSLVHTRWVQKNIAEAVAAAPTGMMRWGLLLPFGIIGGMMLLAISWSALHPVTSKSEDTGQQTQMFTGQTGTIRSLAISPDGKFLASNSSDFTTRIWDLASGENVLTLDQVLADQIAFSPDSTWLAIGEGRTSGTLPEVRVWQVNSGNKVAGFDICEFCDIRNLTFSEDNTRLAVSACYNSELFVQIWDIKSGTMVADYFNDSNCMAGQLVFLNGKLVSEDTGNPELVAFDENTLEVQFSKDYDQDDAFAEHGFSADGTLLAAVEHDPNIEYADRIANVSVIDVWNDELLFSLDTNITSFFPNLVFSPDNHWLAISLSNGDGFEIQIWDIESGQKTGTLPGRGYDDLFFAPNGQYLATTSTASSPDGTAYQIAVWDLTSLEKIHDFSGHRLDIEALIFSPDSSTIISGSQDLTIRVWELTP